jgi:hypothetical protein
MKGAQKDYNKFEKRICTKYPVERQKEQAIPQSRRIFGPGSVDSVLKAGEKRKQ